MWSELSLVFALASVLAAFSFVIDIVAGDSRRGRRHIVIVVDLDMGERAVSAFLAVALGEEVADSVLRSITISGVVALVAVASALA